MTTKPYVSFLFLSVALLGCGSGVKNTQIPQPNATPISNATPIPSGTPIPSATPAPSFLSREKIAFFSSGDDLNTAGIYVMSPDGTEKVRINNESSFTNAYFPDPIISPDGKKVVVSNLDYYNPSTIIMDIDGSNVKRLSSNRVGEFDVNMVFSPDGSKILFYRHYYINQSYNTDVSGIYIMNADGTGKKKIINNDEGFVA
jgi:Tol biopolymer transport system component